MRSIDCSSEGNCQLLHERLTAVKKERDTIETESRAKIGTLSQNLKELQHSSKTLMDQFRVQSKQCEHLDRENKQLTEYVVRTVRCVCSPHHASV